MLLILDNPSACQPRFDTFAGTVALSLGDFNNCISLVYTNYKTAAFRTLTVGPLAVGTPQLNTLIVVNIIAIHRQHKSQSICMARRFDSIEGLLLSLGKRKRWDSEMESLGT
jgi:hypothetical protein